MCMDTETDMDMDTDLMYTYISLILKREGKYT